MRRCALLVPALLLLMSGCSGFLHFVNDTSGLTVNQNAPIGDSENMERARGGGVDIKPLLTQPGDVWPGPPPPEPTLSDLQRMQTSEGPQGLGNPHGSPAAPPPLPPALVLPPGGNAPLPKGANGQSGSIVIPNGNGTSTVIAADGNVRTIPTPK